MKQVKKSFAKGVLPARDNSLSSAKQAVRQSAIGLFGSLKSRKKFPGRDAERRAVLKAVGAQAAREGL